MRLFFVILFLVFGCGAYAQDEQLLKNELGNYTFLKVVKTDRSVSEMAANARKFYDKHAKALKVDAVLGDTVFSGKGKMILRKGSAGIGHPTAEATYDFNLELRAGRYRLVLTNFVLTPYERDRYGNFVPVTVSAPLEQDPGKLNAAAWQRDKKLVEASAGKLAGELKQALIQVKASEQDVEKRRVTADKNW